MDMLKKEVQKQIRIINKQSKKINTTKKKADPNARRIISSISAYPFHGEENIPRQKITASASLISFPGDASSPEELIFKAHQALKEAKSAGGGRVKIYGQ